MNTLSAEILALDWKKRQNTVADVVVTIETVIDSALLPKFEKDVYDAKCKGYLATSTTPTLKKVRAYTGESRT